MLFLPSIHGRFPVGITTFVTPVRPAQIVGSVKLRNVRHGQLENALCLEEVAFTVYYPTEKPTNSQEGVDWFIRQVLQNIFFTHHNLSLLPDLSENLWMVSPHFWVCATFTANSKVLTKYDRNFNLASMACRLSIWLTDQGMCRYSWYFFGTGLPLHRYQRTPTLPCSIQSLPRSRKNHHQVIGLSLFFLMVWVEAVRLIGRWFQSRGVIQVVECAATYKVSSVAALPRQEELFLL